MLLVLDVGDTNATCGIFRDPDKPDHVWRLAAQPSRSADEYGLVIRQYLSFCQSDRTALRAVAIASGVPAVTDAWTRPIRLYLDHEPTVVAVANQSLRAIRYPPSGDLGIDRIVTPGAARRRFVSPPTVINIGTATAVDTVAAGDVLLGGTPSPGDGAFTDRLTRQTARWLHDDLSHPDRASGFSTQAGRRSGWLLGYLPLLKGFTQRVCAELDPDAQTVATGGVLTVFRTDLDWLAAVADKLTLGGIYYANRKSHE
ncbi:MAG: type III pantothenate kinase [Acidobacteria bacterium]|nr:type III pantothenate kinase [Acidobacteriota bacterium]